MKQRIPILFCIVSLLLFHVAESQENLLRETLLQFLSKLSNNKNTNNSVPGSGWNSSSDPCKDQWRGVSCEVQYVSEIDLGGFGLDGVFDPTTLCNLRSSLSSSLSVLNITKNSLKGENLEAIKNCSKLTHLDISSNRFSAPQLQDSISHLPNLQVLDVSRNEISGSLPDFSQMHGLTVFLGQENNFSGSIPELDFSKIFEFNVSHNNLSGPIPFGAIGFPISSFLNNPELCGPPLPNTCKSAAAAESAPNAASPPPSVSQKGKGNGLTNNQILMYIGYVLIAFVLLFLIVLCLRKKSKKRQKAEEGLSNTNNSNSTSNNSKVAAMDESMSKPSFSTVELKGGKGKFSGAASAESGEVSTSLIVLASPEVNGMRFEDLLKAPAELLGRGSHGSVYKVVCEDHGMVLAVKRIKDWPISSAEFRQRMRRLSQVKHGGVMSAVAYYSSGQEKLIVYEYQKNGSLFGHIHANGNALI